jgi:hypothetical protein
MHACVYACTRACMRERTHIRIRICTCTPKRRLRQRRGRSVARRGLTYIAVALSCTLQRNQKKKNAQTPRLVDHSMVWCEPLCMVEKSLMKAQGPSLKHTSTPSEHQGPLPLPAQRPHHDRPPWPQPNRRIRRRPSHTTSPPMAPTRPRAHHCCPMASHPTASSSASSSQRSPTRKGGGLGTRQAGHHDGGAVHR